MEAHHARSAKYDAWAHLAAVDIDGLAALVQAGPDRDRARLLTVDLFPGDVLYIPRLWWHQVENLSASLLLSGFFGAPSHVLPRWATVTTRHLLHLAGITGRRGCTCHPAPTGPGPVAATDTGREPVS